MTWDEIIGKTYDAAEYVGKKTEDFVELTRLKLALTDVERELAATMEGLGRLVYDAKKSNTDITELLDAGVAEADKLHAKAAMLRRKIAQNKKLRECSECRTFNPEDAAFCKSCGKALD